MKLLILLFLLPLKALSQDITGIWTGYIQTNGNSLPYELVISEDNQKLTGYSLTVFTIDGIENIGLKSIKCKQKNGNISIADDELIYNNFTTTSRKIKVFGQLSLKVRDSVMTLDGTFQTKVVDFRSPDNSSYSGTITLQKQNIQARTRLIRKLGEMNLLSALSFIQSKTGDKQDAAMAEVTEKEARLSAVKGPLAIAPSKQNNTITAPPISNTGKTIEINVAPKINAGVAANDKKDSATDEIPEKETPLSSVKAPSFVTASKQNNAIAAPPISAAGKTIEVVVPPKAAADLAARKTEVIRNIFFTSDSLVLTLYDNGIVDGDTVSVVLNNKVIIPNQGLSEKAFRLVVRITPDLGDSLQLIMYAENLGTIPPNTGLLIVEDGDNRHEIRFEGDMQKSSAVILRRRR